MIICGINENFLHGKTIKINESQVDEVRYLNNDYISNKNQKRNAKETEPLRNDEVIRVFHGFGNIRQAVIAAKNGI